MFSMVHLVVCVGRDWLDLIRYGIYRLFSVSKKRVARAKYELYSETGLVLFGKV